MTLRRPAPGVSLTEEEAAAAERHSARLFRNQFRGEDAYSRHLKYVRDYQLVYGNKRTSTAIDIQSAKTELDIIREHHQFVRDLDEDPSTLTWEERVAKKYYDQLYKEYCLADLRYYREGKIAMRWRTEREVISGKGQFICANLSCDERDGLRSWEVNFAYVEDNIPKNALVKVRLCPECSDKLNYRKRQRLAKVEEEQEESNEVSNHSTDHHTSSPSIETESSTNAMEVDHLDHTSSHQHIKKTSSDERTESRRRYSSKKSHRRSRSPTGTYHRTRDRSDYERTHRHDTSSRDASRNDDDDDDDDDSFQHRTTTSTLRSHRR